MSIFDDPYIKKAYEALPEEEKQKYKAQGKHFFQNVNFDNTSTGDIFEGIDPLAESAASIVMSIKSGLHPSDLDDNEREILKSTLGSTWYLQFGYTEEDLKGYKVQTKRDKIPIPRWAKAKKKK